MLTFLLLILSFPPKDNTFADESHHPKRMTNLISYFALGVTRWQRFKYYGRRNVSETAMQRYKTIIGPKLHSRKFNNQQQEILIGCSNLNRFTQLGMPSSFRVASSYQKTTYLEYCNKALNRRYFFGPTYQWTTSKFQLSYPFIDSRIWSKSTG